MRLGGVGGLVDGDLPGDENGIAGARLFASGRNTDPLFGPDVKDKSQQGWLWTYSHPRDDVAFDWKVSRSREALRQFLEHFRGKLQTEGYGVYESLARERDGQIILVGCWAHARRGFSRGAERTPGGMVREPNRFAL